MLRTLRKLIFWGSYSTFATWNRRASGGRQGSKIRAASCGTYFISISLCSFINVNYINCKLNVLYSTSLESRESILRYLEAHSFHKSLEMTYSIGRRLKAGWESLGIDMKMLCLMFKYSILSCSCISYTTHSTDT
jgi:hypothetical protein